MIKNATHPEALVNNLFAPNRRIKIMMISNVISKAHLPLYLEYIQKYIKRIMIISSTLCSWRISDHFIST